MYCDGSITIMWSLNVFINDFPLPCRRANNQSCQDIRLRPARLLNSVFQPLSDVNYHPILQ